MFKYKEGKKRIKENVHEMKRDYNNWSKIKKVFVYFISVLCVIGVMVVAYLCRSELSYDSIALLDNDGDVTYPIGVDIIKEGVENDITFFTYNTTEKLGDSEITYPALYKLQK